MELQVTDFKVITFKKKTILSTIDFQESGNPSKAKSKIISNVKKGLEKVVIELGAITTFAGMYSLIYPNGNKKPWVLISYKPTFSFEVFSEYREIVNFLKLIDGMTI